MKRTHLLANLVFWVFIGGCSDGSTNDMQAASTNIDRGNYQTAIVILKNVVSNSPENFEARRMLAEAHLKTGNFAAAEKELDIVLRRNSEDPSLINDFSMAMYRNESYTGLQKAYSIYADKSEGIKYYHALALRKLGDTERSNELLNEVSAGDSNYAPLSKAVLELVSKRFDDATKSVNAIVESDLHEIKDEALWLKIQILTMSGESQLAAEELESYTDQKPYDLKAKLLLGVEYIRSKQYSKAEPLIEGLYERNKNNGLLNELKAYIALNGEDRASAMPLLMNANQMGRKSPGLYLEIAKLANELEQYETAYRFLSLIGEDYSKNVDYVNRLKLQVALRLGYTEEALKIYDPENKYLDDNLAAELGYQLKRNGQPFKALEVTKNYISNKGKGDAFFEEIISYLENDEVSLDELYEGASNSDDDFALIIISAFEKGDFSGALDIADKWVNKSEGQQKIIALEFAAYAALKAGQKELSDSYYSQLLKIAPNNVSANLNALEDKIRGKDWESVESVLVRLVEENPQNEKLLKLFFDTQMARGEAVKSLSFIKTFYEGKKDFRASVLYAYALFMKSDFAGVVEVLQKFSKVANPDVNYLRFYTLSLSATGEIDRAIKFLQAQERSFPRDGNVKMFLIFLLEAKGEFEAADRVAQKLVEMFPNDPRLLFARIELLIKNNEFAKAEKVLSEVPDNLKNIDLYKLMNGKVLLGRGEADKAVQALQGVINENSRGEDVLYYAYALASTKKHDEAFNLLRTHLVNEPNDVPVITALADGLKSTKPLESANLYLKLYELDSNNLLALNNAAYLFMKGEELQKAQQLVDKALAAGETLPYLIDTAARIYAKLDGVSAGNAIFESMMQNSGAELLRLQCQYFSDTDQLENAETCKARLN
ncbi:MAG: tetratricopeptide repeat protein [Pseudomonadota bacterium]